MKSTREQAAKSREKRREELRWKRMKLNKLFPLATLYTCQTESFKNLYSLGFEEATQEKSFFNSKNDEEADKRSDKEDGTT